MLAYKSSDVDSFSTTRQVVHQQIRISSLRTLCWQVCIRNMHIRYPITAKIFMLTLYRSGHSKKKFSWQENYIISVHFSGYKTMEIRRKSVIKVI